MNKCIKNIFWVLVLFSCAFLVISHLVWQVNNPKANEMTFYSHFNDVIHFRTLPQFQER